MNKKKTKFGYCKFCSYSALFISILTGLSLAFLISLIKVYFNGYNKGILDIILSVSILTICLSIPIITLIWKIIVDKNTIEKVLKPDESVEKYWEIKANSWAFHSIICVCSIGTVASMFYLPSIVSITLFSVLLFSIFIWFISYILARWM